MYGLDMGRRNLPTNPSTSFYTKNMDPINVKAQGKTNNVSTKDNTSKPKHNNHPKDLDR